jgi:hypothetical protein
LLPIGVALAQKSKPRAQLDDGARATIKAKLLEFRDATELRARRVLDSQLNGTKYAVVVTTAFDFKRFYGLCP